MKYMRMINIDYNHNMINPDVRQTVIYRDQGLGNREQGLGTKASLVFITIRFLTMIFSLPCKVNPNLWAINAEMYAKKTWWRGGREIAAFEEGREFLGQDPKKAL